MVLHPASQDSRRGASHLSQAGHHSRSCRRHAGRNQRSLAAGTVGCADPSSRTAQLAPEDFHHEKSPTSASLSFPLVRHLAAALDPSFLRGSQFMRNREMRNRVVVITGASSGFGRGAALKFAEAGANVVLAARRRRALKDVAKECEQKGAKALVVETDVSNPEEVSELAQRAVDKFGRIDVWVNSAGVGAVGQFDETPLEEHAQVIKTNLLGTIYGSSEALQQFPQHGHGGLINVGLLA